MNDSRPDDRKASRSAFGRWFLLLFLLALAGVLAWRGWSWWQAQQALRAAEDSAMTRQTEALAARVDALRADQRAQAERIRRAESTNGVLRDEVLGVGQRAALLEDSLERLADPDSTGAQALRLDEVELLLATGQQRLQLAGDLDGARQAYALAAGVMDGVDDPDWLDVRQSLAQERKELEALGADPRTDALRRLDAFAASLDAPGSTPAPAGGQADLPWWRRLFGRLVQVRRSDPELAMAPADRAAGYAALQLEVTLARAAAERRDVAAWRSALQRTDAWLRALWPDSPARQARRAELQALRAHALRPALPALGSTLAQLRAQRRGR